MTTLAVTKGLAIASSLFSGGALTTLSLITVPTLLSAPHNIAAKQFKLLATSGVGFAVQPAASLVATLLHGLAAYQLYSFSPNTAWGRWVASAALTAAILPYTLGVMNPVASSLLAIAGTSEKREGGTEVSEKTEGLLRTWEGLNVVRAGLAVGAGLVGLWEVLELV